MNARRWAGIIGSMLLVVPAYAFAPAPLGGTTYATVSGTSMRPMLSPGDLVILRASTYEVGDVVAFRDDAGALILHRIVADDGARLTLKGDANEWVDSATPTREQISGELWFSVPGAGFLVTRGPMLLLAVGALAVAISMAGIRRRRKRRAARAAEVAPSAHATLERSDRVGALATGGVAAVFACLGALTFIVPAATDQRDYTQTGTMTYSATTPPDAAYVDGRVRTGDPVFLRLVDRLTMGFTYEMHSDAPVSMEGAMAITATIRDQGSRWVRTLVLREPARILPPRQTTSAALDLRALTALTERFETTTGQKPPHYDVEVTASVDLVGTVDGISHATSLVTTTAYTMNDDLLQPKDVHAAGDGGPVTVTNAGSVRATTGAGTVLGVPTPPLRAAAVAGTIVFALLSLPYARRARRAVLRQPRRIARLIVEARTDASTTTASAAVSVMSMEDLAWIAHRGSRPILHEQRGDLDLFEVHDGEIVYRFDASKVHASA